MQKQIYPLIKPFRKPFGFNPSIIKTNGIPPYADSMLNPKVYGTPAWKEFWEEQLYYILNGYWTAGVYIPGRYYYFLNYCKTTSVDQGEAHYADFVDFQYDFFLLIEHAKQPDVRKNILAPKGGRKGVSVMASSVIDYGYRFIPGYKAGIAGGAKEYSDDFLAKWKAIDSLVVNEFKTRKTSKGWDDIIAGWEEKTDLGGFNTYGSANTIYSRTMFSNPNIFEGKFLNEVVFEEAGLFDNLLLTFDSAVECMKRGNIQYGTFYIYGRGGNIKTGSKGFEYMWHHADDYNCIKFPILGKQYYIPCVAGTKDETGKLIEDIPNLLQYAEHERVGMEDTVRAEELIVETNKKLLASGNIKKWLKHSRDNPIDVKEFFRRAASNNFDSNVLSDQGYAIHSQEESKYAKYTLEFEKTPQGEIVMPYRVYAVPANEETDENDCVMILHEGFPMPGYRNLDVGGNDSYDQDQTLTSTSLGAMVILRKDNQIPNVVKMTPVLLIRCRPRRKELFYEMCMKAAIFYDLKQNLLGDVRTPAIIEYFKSHGCQMYLAKRPVKFESENTQQKNEFWVSINSYSKPLMISLIQSYVLDYGKNIWFIKMIEELQNYDELEDKSDNDSVDALGIALMQMVSNQGGVIDEKELMKKNPFAYTSWTTDSEGNIVSDTMINNSLIGDKEMLKRNGIDPMERMIELQMMRENIIQDEEENDGK